MKTVIAGALLFVLADQASQRPTFRTDVNLVEVDVVVVGDEGLPVRGLQQREFEVLEDGKRVEVAAFTAVDLPQAPEGAAIPAPDLSGTARGTNAQPDDGRIVLVVLDDYHISFDAGRAVAARKAVTRLIERLGPSDLAAVMTTSGSRVSRAEFTSDKARLVEAANRFFPQSEVPSRGVAEQPPAGGARFGFVQEFKARWAMDALSSAAKALALIPHRRKAVLLVSQGIPVSLEEIITNPSAGGAWQGLRDFILTAQRSNIAVYPVDPCGLSRDTGCSIDTQEHLHSIAEGTGGFAIVNTNAPERAVERMVAENGTYYLLGYYSPAPNDGKRHRITVHVGRPGVHVRAREGYVSPRGNPPPAASRPLDALVEAPIQTRGLPMRIAAVPAPLGGRPGSTIVVSIELRAEDAVGAGRIAFDAVAVDPEGHVRSRLRFMSGFEGGPRTTGQVIRVGARLDVPSGRYQIRIAAVAAGVQGSVFTEVDVPKFDRPLSLGGLALATSSAVPAASAERLGDVLPSIPIAAREVPSSAKLVALVPVKAARNTQGEVTIRTHLIGPDGKTTVLDRTTAAASEYAGDAGKLHRVPLNQLTPGSYRLVVRVTTGKHDARRELQFTAVVPGS